MSFILDALRKSETERQKDAGPPLSRIPMASTRSVVPAWAWVTLVALGATVLALGGGWWQSMRSVDVTDEAPAAAASSPDAGSTASGRPDTGAFAGSRDPARSTASATGVEVASAQDLAAAASTPNSERAAAASVPTSAPEAVATVSPAPEPAVRDPVDARTGSPPSRPAASTVPVPTLAELLAGGVALPPLTLELLVFHSDPAGRFVFINGSRYAEGQRLTEGPRVVDIRAESVLLNQDGRDFVLLPQ